MFRTSFAILAVLEFIYTFVDIAHQEGALIDRGYIIPVVFPGLVPPARSDVNGSNPCHLERLLR